MNPRDVRTADDAMRIVEQRDIEHVKVGVFDIDGVLRGKYMSRRKFLSALEGGFGFCNVVLGWDSNDQLYDNVTFTGWHTGYPDAPVRLLPESCRVIPWEERTLPIRLTPMTATCRVPPLSRVEFGIGWSGGVARDAEQRAEGVERVKPPVEAEGELVEVGL